MLDHEASSGVLHWPATNLNALLGVWSVLGVKSLKQLLQVVIDLLGHKLQQNGLQKSLRAFL